MTKHGITAELAEFAATFPGDDIPESARRAGLRTILNAVSLAVGAARHDAVNIAVDVVGELGTPERATVLGRPERFGLTWTALINGMATHVEDFDDTHLRTVIHPGAPVVPAALSVAEAVGASGAEFVTAVIVGVEVALRVGISVVPGHFDRGWHLTGTMGHLGAAAAAGRLLELETDELVVALGLAATQAAGLQEALGTMTKSFHPGKAAANGVEAALLANSGLNGPDAPIEGRRGLLNLSAPAPDFEVILEDLGGEWEIEANAFKPYACGIVSHPVIDGGIALRERVESAAEIESVEATINPVVLDVMGVEDPMDGLESKFSMYHCFAVGFLYGNAGPDQFTDDVARDPTVADLRSKVTATLDPGISTDEAIVMLRTTDGEWIEHHVEHATGSAAAPMTDCQLRDKARLAATPTLGDRTEELLTVLGRLDDLNDLRPLIAAATPTEDVNA